MKKDLEQKTRELKAKQDELVIAQKDVKRFKEMAENYMKQIADQPSAVKAEKPAAAKKRPNDTVKREQSATNNKQTKVERVNPKKL